MARRLVECGHEVTMVCGSYRGGETGLIAAFTIGRRRGMVDGIEVIEFNLDYSNGDGFIRRSMTFMKYVFRSISLGLIERFDLVFATTTPLTASIPGILAHWLRGETFIFEVRDLWSELPKAMGVICNPLVLSAMSVLEWVSYHLANRLIDLSSGIVKGIERRDVPPGRITLVSNACDLVFLLVKPSLSD